MPNHEAEDQAIGYVEVSFMDQEKESMNEGLVLLSVEGKIATVTLDAPTANALEEKVLDELEETFQQLEKMDLTAVILTGKEGRFFCAGANIKEFFSRSAEGNQAYFKRLYEVLELVENCTHPVIAAVNGYAMGGGLELALCADIRVADEMAELGATGVNLGLVFCTQRLPRFIGEGRAKEMLLTARVIEGVEAKKIGLVEYLAPVGKAVDKAMEIAELIGQKAPLAIRGVKASIQEGRGQQLEEGLRTESKHLDQMLATQEFQIRVKDFLT